jgi:uncharacterized DUF497 family protein
MKISYDPAKRAMTLAKRGLDFEHAAEVFAGLTITFQDDRFDYGEVRWVTYGFLRGRLVAVVWTQRGGDRHVISLRKCNDKEKKKYQARLA